MNKVDKFLSDLKNYDKKGIRPFVIEALMPYLNVSTCLFNFIINK